MRKTLLMTGCLVALLTAQPAAGESNNENASSPFVRCTFYPQAQDCQAILTQATQDSDPRSQSVRNAYLGYAKYLRDAHGELTDEDRRFLQDHDIRLPSGLSTEDLAGLHNVIHDDQIRTIAERVSAVNNFIGRAVSAELYCAFNECRTATPVSG